MSKDWVGNNASLYRIMGASNHSDTEREKDDFYATDPKAIDALAEKWQIPNTILEPACGSGHLAIRLEQLGHHVIATDKVDRGYGDVRDFFSYTTMPEGCECIITNPPYKFATEFVEHSLRLLPDGGWCAMFVKTTFLEGQKRFKAIFSHYPPLLVLQFVQRIKCAKNGDFEAISGSAVAYCWIVWQKGYQGPTTLDWINYDNDNKLSIAGDPAGTKQTKS